MALPRPFISKPISPSMSDETGDFGSLSRLCVSCPTEAYSGNMGTLREAFALSAVASLRSGYGAAFPSTQLLPRACTVSDSARISPRVIRLLDFGGAY